MTDRKFDPTRDLVMAAALTVHGHALSVGQPLQIGEEAGDGPGEVDRDMAERLWGSQRATYADEARPTPVETSQQSAARLVELDELKGGYFSVRAPWIKSEKVRGREKAEARVAELLEAGDPRGTEGYEPPEGAEPVAPDENPDQPTTDARVSGGQDGSGGQGTAEVPGD